MRNPFARYLPKLATLTKELLHAEPVSLLAPLPKNVPLQGIYMFSEDKRHLYVGKSDNLRRRLHLHTRPGAQHNQATFAFRITREQFGIQRPSYRTEGSRPDLVRGLRFNAAFLKAKERVRNMEVRFVPVEDAILQTLLEVYVAMCLHTKYNEFKNT
jgi:hypothetical protein